MRFPAAERRETPGALASDQRLEAGVEDRGLGPQSAQSLGFREEAVIEVEGGPHLHEHAIMMQICQGGEHRRTRRLAGASRAKWGMHASERGLALDGWDRVPGSSPTSAPPVPSRAGDVAASPPERTLPAGPFAARR